MEVYADEVCAESTQVPADQLVQVLPKLRHSRDDTEGVPYGCRLVTKARSIRSAVPLPAENDILRRTMQISASRFLASEEPQSVVRSDRVQRSDLGTPSVFVNVHTVCYECRCG